jgi:tetrahydromethanopterin S-methyltransferase subunit A
LKLIAENWPPVKGDYVTGNPDSRIAVVTLASHLDACPEAAIWGSSKTENLGVEKIIVNVISNSNIRYVLVCGTESRGHLAGHSLLAIHANGIDEQGRIKGSHGAIPFIENISRTAVERFQQQVTLLNRIGLNDPEKIRKLVEEYKEKGEAYPEEPMVVCAPKKRQPSFAVPTSGDIIISEEFVMDSKAGIICLAENL